MGQQRPSLAWQASRKLPRELRCLPGQRHELTFSAVGQVAIPPTADKACHREEAEDRLAGQSLGRRRNGWWGSGGGLVSSPDEWSELVGHKVDLATLRAGRLKYAVEKPRGQQEGQNCLGASILGAHSRTLAEPTRKYKTARWGIFAGGELQRHRLARIECSHRVTQGVRPEQRLGNQSNGFGSRGWLGKADLPAESDLSELCHRALTQAVDQ